mmetsp:Transcript_1244/g.2037  ORF Transcript_1244/g.2037 Transcript_1244/m.2037 type:complete len:170 (-) Transcript_1244:144-653(-)
MIQGEWLQCALNTYIILSREGDISIRENETNSLVCDLPRRELTAVEVVSDDIIRYSTGSDSKLAVHFQEPSTMHSVLSAYNEHGLKFSDIREERKDSYPFPDCNDPAIQETLLRMLFTDGFEKFVADVETWLCRVRQGIVSYGPGATVCPGDKTSEEEEESTWEQEVSL